MARNIKKEVQKHKERSYTNKDFKSLRNELRRYALTHFSLYGTPEERERSNVKEGALRARIRAARAYLRSDAYADDLARENDWIAR